MEQEYVIAGLLLAIPTIVLLILPMYNRVNPTFLGLPFFYWFQGLWLFIAAFMYVGAATIISRKLGES